MPPGLRRRQHSSIHPLHRYFQRKAEPVLDTPNTVLRRELPLRQSIRASGSTPLGAEKTLDSPSLPPGTPMALREILEVVHQVRTSGCRRPDATNDVAGKFGVIPLGVYGYSTGDPSATSSCLPARLFQYLSIFRSNFSLCLLDRPFQQLEPMITVLVYEPLFKRFNLLDKLCFFFW
ncbi:hypothetical protein NKDENANG_03797 [Candidatus Entotheonellaceae bacterium PAL068K]